MSERETRETPGSGLDRKEIYSKSVLMIQSQKSPSCYFTTAIQKTPNKMCINKALLFLVSHFRKIKTKKKVNFSCFIIVKRRNIKAAFWLGFSMKWNQL